MTNVLVALPVPKELFTAERAGLRRRLVEMVDELKELGHVRRDLSADAGKSHAWVDSLLKGKPKSPEVIPLARLAERHGYNVRWLVTGRGPKRVDPELDARAARERGDLTLEQQQIDSGIFAQPASATETADEPERLVRRVRPRSLR